MAICYDCGQKFYGRHCDSCGWEAAYKCWACTAEVTPDDHHCGSCGWFECTHCGNCGCSSERPESNEEKEGY